MNELPDAAREALATFAQAPGWEQRARLLMQWGERLEPVNDGERSEINRVAGCESHVWLIGQCQDGRWHFRAASDARLIRGLLAVLLVRVNGLDADELARVGHGRLVRKPRPFTPTVALAQQRHERRAAANA